MSWVKPWRTLPKLGLILMGRHSPVRRDSVNGEGQILVDETKI